MINWNNIICNLKNGKIIIVDPVVYAVSQSSSSEYQSILALWKSKNFNTASVKWTNYYDTKDIELEIAQQVSITPIRSWISCVEPGYMTGYHYDIDDNEQEYLKNGTLKRYTVFISEPDVGHVFVLGKDYYFNQLPGTILKWDNYRDWHNGINGGLSNKYMFHILGY